MTVTDTATATAAIPRADTPEECVLKVAGNQSTTSLASMIAHAIYEGQNVTLRAIGASAISQAMKAVAGANGYTAPRGLILSVRPAFVDLKGNKGDDMVGMAFAVLVSR